MSNLKIYIAKKEYNNYADLVKFIKGTLSGEINGNSSGKKDIIALLKTFKDMLVKGQNTGIYKLLSDEKVQDDVVYRLQLYIKMADVELLKSILSYLITITDNSELMCEAFVVTELPSILINTVIRACSNDIPFQFSKDVTLEDIVAQLVLVMHNIARHNQFQQVFMQHKKVKKLKSQLMVYLDSKDKRTVILTMALLTWLAEDDGQDKFVLGKHSYIIDNFSDHINKGIKDKGRWYEGLCVWELLLVLQSLSCMDSVEHSFFLTEKFMKMISNILTSKSSLPQEIKIALGIVWNLSFVDNNRRKMMTDFKMETPIKGLMHHSDEKIRKTSLDLLWELSNNQDKSVSKKKPLYDVFISYCHAQNEVVKKLVEELKKKFSVWVDSEGIKGSGLDDMARGIETSRILVMGVSHSYKQSQCCHSEASWAYRLKKPIIPLLMVHKYKPDGWLGMMISSETYIDVSDMENIAKSVLEIEEHIRHKCADLVSVNITVVVTPKEREVRGGSSVKCLEEAGKMVTKDWKKSDVSAWLVGLDMSDLVSVLSDLDGKMLLSLKEMKTNYYSDYHNHVKEDLKLSFNQILKLDSAISDLHI